MTKSELIDSLISKNTQVDENAVIESVNSILGQISETLEQGGRVEIRGFGSFSLRQWGARYARNPQTGESWWTEPSNSVYFKPGKDLRERVNEQFIISSKPDIEEEIVVE